MKKKIDKKALLIVSCICALFTFFSSKSENYLIIGSIQFPKSIQDVPDIRIYCGGHIIKCEINNESKKISFTIPKKKDQLKFYMLIAENIRFESAEKNVIKYLKLVPSQQYKFYYLTFGEEGFKFSNDHNFNDLKEMEEFKFRPFTAWSIQEQKLPEDGRIPDNAIIICYNPEYIETLEGGNSLEFPIVLIRQDILTLVGSEDKLREFSDMLFLASLDSDTIHSNIQQKTIKPAQGIVIALNIRNH